MSITPLHQHRIRTQDRLTTISLKLECLLSSLNVLRFYVSFRSFQSATSVQRVGRFVLSVPRVTWPRKLWRMRQRPVWPQRSTMLLPHLWRYLKNVSLAWACHWPMSWKFASYVAITVLRPIHLTATAMWELGANVCLGPLGPWSIRAASSAASVCTFSTTLDLWQYIPSYGIM